MKAGIVQRLWRGHDPMQTVVVEDRPADAQGWNSDHRYLTEAIAEVRPRLVVEVGVWKGGSVMTMARALKSLQLDGAVIAVDTWQGSWEHWLAPQGEWGIDTADDPGFDRGRSRLYEKFIANVRAAELQDYVVPLPLDSNNAAHVLTQLGVRAGVIHLDGGHDYDAVWKDIHSWWPLLEPGGVMVCDDYYEDGNWPDVRRAVDEFARSVQLTSFESEVCKARLKKPAA